MFLLGFLLICSVQAAFGQDATAPAPAPAAGSIPNGQKTRIAGVVVSSDTGTMTVRDKDGNETVVLVGGDTDIKPNQGCTAICPGRCVKVEGRGNCSGQLVAEEIKFRKDDCNICYFDSILDQLKQADALLSAKLDSVDSTAKTARAEAQAAQAAAENARQAADVALAGVKAGAERWANLDEYTATEEAVVTFETGKATLKADDKAILDQFAAKALASKGYMITISGFTDSTGREGFNNELSDKRAGAVMRYLVSVANVPVRRIQVIYGGGETSPAADNSSRHGRAVNRRAVARLLVNPALAGETLTQTSTDH
jgi:outer membrane protein OmpA-like peptidoglycan-associated protein